MAMPVWTLQDAKNRFSAVVEAAVRGEPQKVTRRGKWVSVVLSAAEYERLLAMPQDDGAFERLSATPRDLHSL